MAGNQGNDSVRAFDAPVDIAYRFKQMGRLQGHAACGAFDFMGQHIEQHFGVALGVDMPVVHGKQLVLERLRIGQIAVVHQHNAKGRIDIKRLGLFLAKSIACGRIAHLAQATVTRQRAHVAGAKYIFDHALGLVHEKLVFLLRHDARCILAAVLQQQQSVINELVDWSVADNAYDSTHARFARSR